MNKKMLIIIGAAGLVSFGGTFFIGLKTKKSPPPSVQAVEPPAADANTERLSLASPALHLPAAEDTAGTKDITEKQLKDLVFEVREKISEYDNKLKELELREKNLQAARDALKKDANELDALRIELTSTLSSIKSEQEKLEKMMIQITLTEENNLKSIAATYDKMDSAQAGKILSNMTQSGRGADDAIKILYYMSERTKAKVLAAIAETEPAVSANFSQRLKKISVKDN